MVSICFPQMELFTAKPQLTTSMASRLKIISNSKEKLYTCFYPSELLVIQHFHTTDRNMYSFLTVQDCLHKIILFQRFSEHQNLLDVVANLFISSRTHLKILNQKWMAAFC
jgi:hypothetical protein